MKSIQTYTVYDGFTPRRRKGFSLLEVSIVIAVIAILLAALIAGTSLAVTASKENAALINMQTSYAVLSARDLEQTNDDDKIYQNGYMMYKEVGERTFYICPVVNGELQTDDLDSFKLTGSATAKESDVLYFQGQTSIATASTTYAPSQAGYSYIAVSKTEFEDMSDNTAFYRLATIDSSTPFTITYTNTKSATNSNPSEYTYACTDSSLGYSTSGIYTLASLPDSEGYTFLGWYEGDTLVTSFSSYRAANLTFRAEWALTEYTITYDLGSVKENGVVSTAASLGATANTSNPSTYTVESTFSLRQPVFTSYTFMGWYTEVQFDNSGNEKDSSSCTRVASIQRGTTGNMKLYAWWTEEGYSITYLNVTPEDPYDSTNDQVVNNPNPTSYLSTGDNIDLIDLTYPDGRFTFGGWFDTSTSQVVTEIDVSKSGDRIYSAIWTESTYSIYLDTQSGYYGSVKSDSYVVTITYGQTYTFPTSDMSRTDFSFVGWFTSTSSSASQVTELESGTYYATTPTFYARWNSTVYYINCYYYEGPTVATPTELKASIGTLYTLPTPTCSGCKFLGWYTDYDSGTGTFSGAISTIDADNEATVTVYGSWKLAYTEGLEFTLITIDYPYASGKPISIQGYYVSGDTGTATNILIPATYGSGSSEHPVIAFADEFLSGNTYVTSVAFVEGAVNVTFTVDNVEYTRPPIISIGENAFYGCKNLTSFNIGTGGVITCAGCFTGSGLDQTNLGIWTAGLTFGTVNTTDYITIGGSWTNRQNATTPSTAWRVVYNDTLTDSSGNTYSTSNTGLTDANGVNYQPTKIGDYYYYTQFAGASVGGTQFYGYSGTNYKVIIPSYYNGVPVTAIYGYYNGTTNLSMLTNQTIDEIVFSKKLMSIGSFALVKVTCTQGITIPDTVVYIGYESFVGGPTITATASSWFVSPWYAFEVFGDYDYKVWANYGYSSNEINKTDNGLYYISDYSVLRSITGNKIVANLYASLPTYYGGYYSSYSMSFLMRVTTP